jgi:hypothetical protein
MRLFAALFAALFFCIGFGASAQAEPLASIVFSGNSWGYLKPCPS